MGNNLVTKLNSILASKIAISGALETKGIEINNAPFSSYADLISEISGGESSLYKCVSVDLTNHTWTGYKAIFNGEEWSFNNQITTGLSYEGFIPIINNIYNSNTTIIVSKLWAVGRIPTDQLVYYQSFNGTTEPEVGSYTNTPAYTPIFNTINEVTFAKFTKGTYYTSSPNLVFSENIGNFSYSVNIMYDSLPSNKEQIMCTNINTGSYYFGGCLYFENNALKYGPYNEGTSISPNTWYNLILTVSLTSNRIIFDYYINGVLLSHREAGRGPESINDRVCVIGNDLSLGSQGFSGNMFDACLYNKILTSDEISQLVDRITPLAN